MNSLVQIGILIVTTLGGLYLLIVLLRFLLQLSRADFYNPLSQFIAKATNPLLLPLRRIVPGFFGLDIACLLLATAVQFITVFLGLLMVGTFNPLVALLWGILGMLSMVMYIYYICIFAVFILSWIAPHTRHPAAILASQLIQPLCAPFQKRLPSLGGFDLSPIFVLLIMQILRILLEDAAAYLGAVGGVRSLIPGLL